jgi:chaperone LolA
LVDISRAELQKIQDRLEKLQYLSVKFEQIVSTPLRGKAIPYSGEAKFSRPSLFRWDQDKPTKKKVIYDGKDLYMYFPSEQVAHKYSAKGSQASEIERLASIVLSINSLLELYQLNESKYDAVNKIVYMTLVPKTKGEIAGLKVEVNALKDYIKSVEVTYADGKVIAYNFAQPKRTEVPKAEFTFIKPKGVKLEVFD